MHKTKHIERFDCFSDAGREKKGRKNKRNKTKISFGSFADLARRGSERTIQNICSKC